MRDTPNLRVGPYKLSAFLALNYNLLTASLGRVVGRWVLAALTSAGATAKELRAIGSMIIANEGSTLAVQAVLGEVTIEDSL